MAEIDPHLRILAYLAREKEPDRFGVTRFMTRFAPEFVMIAQRVGLEGARALVSSFGTNAGVAIDGDETTKLRVLVEFDPEVPWAVEAAEKRGLTIRARAGRVAAGDLDLDRLEEFAEKAEGALRVEGAATISPELDVSLGDVGAHVGNRGEPAGAQRGANVIIGLIDSGIDWQHPCLRAADGSTRILRIWDQQLLPSPGETAGSQGYGVEYNEHQINEALNAPDPSRIVRHMDWSPSGHGTHVAGIASGNGTAADDNSAGSTYVGIAPEASLVVVAVRPFPIGTTNDVLYAVDWIFGIAEELGRPCVINLSAGDHRGAHNGTSLLEVYLADKLSENAGRVFVKSAGNDAARGLHASGQVPQDATVDLYLELPESAPSLSEDIDIWYALSDLFGVSLLLPGAFQQLQYFRDPTTMMQHFRMATPSSSCQA